MALLTQKPRGTEDIIPSESYKWHFVEGKLRSLAHRFGHNEIRFPTFEHTELFHRSIGDTTDVVEKEMYTFTDKGDRSITLRPEGTASVARSLVENSIYAAGLPVKVYYIAPNFRYEKPQAGRLREHHQFGAEYFGSYEPSADAEVISLAYSVLTEVGLRQLALEINSIGCPTCRAEYRAALVAYFNARRDKLCDTCLDRMERNPLRLLDCKNPDCQAIAKDAPLCTDYLCDDCAAHFSKVQGYLDDMGIAYTVNPRIVRGLDYYNRTVFEFISTQIGSQGTVCGGGRYDGLVEQIGGPATAGLGFGMGLERLLLVMAAEGVEIPKAAPCDVYLAALGEEADRPVQKLVYELRRMGWATERDTTGRGLKAQMKCADRIGARYAIVIGSNEIANGVGNIKCMETGEQTEIRLEPEAIAAFLEGTK